MKKKRYIWIEGVGRRPAPLTKQEKEARIYALADKMNVKIGKDESRKER